MNVFFYYYKSTYKLLKLFRAQLYWYGSLLLIVYVCFMSSSTLFFKISTISASSNSRDPTNHKLTLSWWRSLTYRNQSIDLQSKSMDWFLYDRSFRHDRVHCSLWLWFFLQVCNIFLAFKPSFQCFRSSHRRCSVRKGVLRNFAKFTGKHLWQSVFLNKVAGWGLGSMRSTTPIIYPSRWKKF